MKIYKITNIVGNGEIVKTKYKCNERNHLNR